MTLNALRELISQAPPALCVMLDGARGRVEPPIRSEIFGLQRFAQHGRSLGEAHRAGRTSLVAATFTPRLQNNIDALREAHRVIGLQATTGYDVSPAAEWLLDNFHLIEAQLREIREGLPRSFFRHLPVLLDEPLAGLPRIYGVAWAFVAHTDGAFDEALLTQFLSAYQETRELRLSEMWALPTTLRVVLIENLRRLAERVATNKSAREAANLCCDHIEAYSVADLDKLLGLLAQRGVDQIFLGQMAQRLQDRQAGLDGPLREWLRRVLPDAGALHARQIADQAADNLSVSNAVKSLRAIGDADWLDIVARTSVLMQLMLSSSVFEAEQVGTRDLALHGIERLARRSGRSEVAVAGTLLELMRAAQVASGVPSVAAWWLVGPRRAELVHALGLPAYAAIRWPALWRRAALPGYLGGLLVCSVALVYWLLNHPASAPGELWLRLLFAVLMIFPASEAVVAVINRLISESLPPEHLPRFALTGGIPAGHRVMVVIPALLTDEVAIRGLVHRLHLHYLANPESQAQFALCSDWTDADSPGAPTDQVLLDCALAGIHELNQRHPADPMACARFLLLHREREFSRTEQCWIGWERKRGKLEQLVAALAQGGQGVFADLGADSRMAPATRHLVTLDSDTQLPPGRLRELVGVAAHPLNRPVLDASGRRVVSGYGILQPRVVVPLPASGDFTLYHWLFAGQCGIDPYSAASSEVYQDVFAEGSFTGKGLLDVQAMHAVLSGRLPEGRVLSHDLLEGALVRCASLTDVTVVEDAPFHADVAASRVHRWTRGDWQLLPFLLRPDRHPMAAINRWKMFDNLRRSLVAPASLALLLLTLFNRQVSPWLALLLVLSAFSAGPLMGAIAGLRPSRDGLAKRHFYRQALGDLARVLWGGLWLLGQLLQQALMALDAIARALWRMGVSHRHLLQWTTAAAAQSQARSSLVGLLRQHWAAPLLVLVLLAALSLTHAPHPLAAVLLGALWLLSPVSNWWVSRAWPADREAQLSPHDVALLQGIARDTWRFFERAVSAGDRWLPPDNLQTTPHDMLAHRTSPTNIGLYLLSAACARRFGWIGSADLLERLEATLASLDGLQRHRGHFLNWYDTRSGEPLLPMYVSTVDSGNLSGHLLAVAEACRELELAPHDSDASDGAIRISRERLVPLLARLPEVLPALLGDAALSRLLALPDPMAECMRKPEPFARLLRQASDDLDALLPEPLDGPSAPAVSLRDELAWCLADHLATLRSACRDRQELDCRATPVPGGVAQPDFAARLHAVAHRCEQLAWESDYSFLYHRHRQLFHIGFRVAEQQLDAGFYDLLASESRLTSLLAIAKGDAPVRHWRALGRPFFASGADAGLRSWSGSMFEYLMPSLLLDEPEGSVMREACHAALREQMAFATAHGLPWGMSESAWAGNDDTLAYQYAPQGVPRLALRRTPADELVVAPYATALAAQIAPHLAVLNFVELQTMGARGRYGFVEALDFSPSRQTDTGRFVRINTFMSHHQGMSIVALANVLCDGVVRRWGMASSHVQAMSSLLHERTPREVALLDLTPTEWPVQALQKRAPGLLRQLVPGVNALEPTHVLGNGRYSVSLRSNGAGRSCWRRTDISRWRDDALRDLHGNFVYLRWDRQPQAVSMTLHPAPDAAAAYQCTYHADRVCFDAAWSEVQAHMTVWVSPEDDVEFRRVELSNLGDRTLDIELMSAFEVTLSDARADEAHPAFTNLFVRARWQAEHEALVFERKARLASEAGVLMAHFVARSDAQVSGLRGLTDRERWHGRNHAFSHPMADFDAATAHAPQEPLAAGDEPGRTMETGLDPVSALAVRLRMAPHSRSEITFATAVADKPEVLHAVIDKYRQASHIHRSSLMSATLTGIRLRALRISSENFAAVQSLTTALVLTLARTSGHAVASMAAPQTPTDRRLLWRFGISGDRAILLVSAGAPQGLGLLRTLAQGLRLWAWGGIACDLVVINAEPASYQMPMQRELAALRERHLADSGVPSTAADAPVTALVLLRADDLSEAELQTLRGLARLHLNADGRPLQHHVQDWIERHEQAFEERKGAASSTVVDVTGAQTHVTPTQGTFDAPTGEFRFDVSARSRPLRPWINVLANPGFGAQLSESGAGYSWAVNSRLNQLTAWSNDPVGDQPSEWFLLQDLRTMQAWSVAPSAWSDERVVYRVAHGQGYSVISHQRDELEVSATWCVDPQSRVKQIRIRLLNRSHRRRNLRVVGLAEWMMGANRSDRATVRTAHVESPASVRGTAGPLPCTTLLATQREHSGGFGHGTAFLSLCGPPADWTCDRRECFDARGQLVLPDFLGQRSGDGLDPCAALARRLSLGAGESTELVFLLGHADGPEAARELADAAAQCAPAQRMDDVRAHWDQLLGATTVQTPDPLFDLLVNRWLLYQTLACRLWAKAGFYQAGGAFGFRDQLQDAMGLVWAAPDVLRRQILLAASRQFAEGDVQHWWHAPTGAGVRTHFSDDLLWLGWACLHYLRATGDAALLDETCPFLEGVTIAAGAEDAYDVPGVSAQSATVFEHAARAIDHSLRVGVHGLPLMGSGDWNDGMNRVGHEGRGESVWLGWFLCALVDGFAPLARRRGETARAEAWEQSAHGWRAALDGPAWDGAWYRRAFFDDGHPLGSQANEEGRIDLIAQAWSVLSGVASQERQGLAMAAVEQHLVDRTAGLIRLLDPPLVHALPSAGYIQAYPPGVRENGGQYSHGAVWALMAQARRAVTDPQAGEAVYRYFTWLSPAHRAADPVQGPLYGLEPYVMAGDICSQPPYAGRGGWSWYTGAAAWMHRAAIESVFGLDLSADELVVRPCLPAHWPVAELHLTRHARLLCFIFMRQDEAAALAATANRGAQLLLPGAALQWRQPTPSDCWVIPLGV